MLGSCVLRVHDSSDHVHRDDAPHSHAEDGCPEYENIRAFNGYENPPYQYDPDSCSTNQYADCCLWEVEDRYDRTCQEYWCYQYDECVWEYQRIICE